MEIKESDLKVLFSEKQIQQRISELAAEMNAFYNGEEVYAVCVLKGAVMFATIISILVGILLFGSKILVCAL